MFWLLWVIIVGLIAGWAAGKIMKGSGYGTLGDVVLGILGGIVGGWLVRLLGFSSGGGADLQHRCRDHRCRGIGLPG